MASELEERVRMMLTECKAIEGEVTEEALISFTQRERESACRELIEKLDIDSIGGLRSETARVIKHVLRLVFREMFQTDLD